MSIRLVDYFREAREELRKVIWPSRQETTRHTVLVIGVSLGVALFLGVLDLVLNLGVENLIAR